MQHEIFYGLRKLEQIRAEEPCFSADANVSTMDSGSSHVLALKRTVGQRELVCLYNFSEEFVQVNIGDGSCRDLTFGTEYSASEMTTYPYGFAWLLKNH